MNNQKTINVGTRSSTLALTQVDEIKRFLADKGVNIDFDVRKFETRGDMDKDKSLLVEQQDDFFTDTLDEAILSGEIDIAIHSAKDLPVDLDENLSIFALTPSPDDTDSYVGHCKLNDLKSGAKIGTSSFLRRDSLKENYPDTIPVDIRGTIQERISQFEEGKYDGIIVATVALKRLGLEDKITDIFPWEGTPLQGQLAVVGRADNEPLKELFKAIDVRTTYGKVMLVGAGPGDPELITVKGVNALKQADCVFYDFLANEELLNYAPNAEKINVGKRKGKQSLPQQELSRMLKNKSFEGKNVVRLKGGDPLVFGRGADEIEYLHSYHIDVDVVAGVSSATAICSSLGIPLTARDTSSSVAFVSGHSKDEKDWEKRGIKIPDCDTIIFFMGLTKIDIIVKSLKEAGWQDGVPVIVVSKGTCPDEKRVLATIGNIQSKLIETPLKPPALIIVGRTIDYFKNER